jgi:dihydrofolate reductase
MGRKTFESTVASLGKPLPGRENIVITRDPDWSYDHTGVLVAHSLEEALAKAKETGSKEIFIGGGSQMYAQAIPHVDRLYLTLIDDEKEGDSFFPPYEHLFTKKIFEEKREWNGLRYTWIDLEREETN